MSVPQDPCFESLKLLVLAKAGILLTSYADAPAAGTLIAASTGQRLSEAAILRAFGYLPAKFPPSGYTKDVLAQYCGYADYAAFCVDQRV